MEMTGKTVLITGASRGIGAAAAREFAKAGANVALVARTADAITDLAKELGSQAIAIPCDVSDFSQVEAAVHACVKAFGQLDILREAKRAAVGYHQTGFVMYKKTNRRNMRAAAIDGPLQERLPRWAAEWKIRRCPQFVRQLRDHARGPTIKRIGVAVSVFWGGGKMRPEAGCHGSKQDKSLDAIG